MNDPDSIENRAADDGSEIQCFTASDGYCLRYRHWSPAEQESRKSPNGFVVALHGIQSHSGWYGYSSRRLCQAGFDVRFLDRRGSGLNEIDRGHAPHPDRLIHDVTQFLTSLQAERDRQQPDAPVILMAVSWGGKLAAVVGGRRPDLCDGIALLYPGLKANVAPSWWQRRLLKLAMATGKHRRNVPIPLDDPELFTSDPDWQQFIREDKLALHRATVGFLSAGVALDAKIPDAMQQIRRPLLMMLAGKDRIIDNTATQSLLDTVATQNRQLLVYEDAAHTLEFEPNRDRIFGDLLTWMQQVSSNGC